MSQLRRFAFFDKELLRDEPNNQINTELQALGITCADGGRGKLIFGDHRGGISLVDRDLELQRFQGYAKFVSYIKQIKRWNVFVTVGDGIDPRTPAEISQTTTVAEAARKRLAGNLPRPEDSVQSFGEGETAIVKVWRSDRQDRDGNPICMQEIKIFAKFPEEAVTAFDVMDDMSMMAIGLRNGQVILWRSNIKGGKEKRAPILLHSSTQAPVTFVGFSASSISSKSTRDKDGKVYLYVGTEKNLTSYCCVQDEPSGKQGAAGPSRRARILDERGIERSCASVNEKGELAVGQEDAVYFYTPDDRGPCYAYDGVKRYIYFFKHYLLVVHLDPRERHVVTVYDLQNKFSAFNFTLVGSSRISGLADDMEKARHITSEWGSIFVITSFGQVYRLTEKDTQSKLEMLYRKNLYSIAIPLAYSAKLDAANIMDIFRMYGDHLYQKGDYDGAINQYMRTIGHVEPSYVIRRFLGAQRIQNLTTYLEALHDKDLANSDHTTLLLNCYTKLKDVRKLNSFIGLGHGDDPATASVTGAESDGSIAKKTKPSSSPLFGDGGSKEAKFDVETAISVLKGSFPQHALYLAKKHSEHSWYLKIELEDLALNAHEGALSADDRKRVADALEYIQSLPSTEVEKYMKMYGKTLITHLPEETTELLKKLCTGKYQPRDLDTKQLLPAQQPTKPLAEDFINMYVDHPDFLRQFLEYYIQEDTRASENVGNTLLEILLLAWRHTFFVEGVPEDEVKKTRKEAEDAVMNLLDSPNAAYNADHALGLVTMTDFKRGQLYLYSKLSMYHMVVQYYLETGNSHAAIEEAKKQGGKDPSLWVLILTHFASHQRREGGKHFEEIREALQYISQKDILPPLQVIQVLSQAREVPLSLVQEYVMARLSHEEELLATDRREIEQLTNDTEKMRREIKDLQSKAIVFQSTKCDLCNRDLDLPAIHFYCGHSYHYSCLPEVERECVQCAPDHRHVIELKKSLEQKANNHEQFFQQLETSADGFQTIAEYFGKGVFITKPGTKS